MQEIKSEEIWGARLHMADQGCLMVILLLTAFIKAKWAYRFSACWKGMLLTVWMENIYKEADCIIFIIFQVVKSYLSHFCLVLD